MQVHFIKIAIACLAGLAVFAHGGVAAQEPALRDVVDQQVTSAWQQQGITPASNASDAEFLRRIMLDLAGVVPDYETTRQFLADEASDKRAKLIDHLLDDPRYAVHQADVWDLLLFGRNPPGYGTHERDGFQRWLREQFAANRPYDQWVRDLLRAEGNSLDQGTPLYFAQYRDQPEDLAEVIAQTFMGVQLQCARCHDHPFEPWTQLDFYGMAAFLARLRITEVGTRDNHTLYALGEKSTGDVLFTGPAKDQRPGQQGEPVKPRFLKGDELVEPPLPEGFKEPEWTANTPPPAPVFSRRDELVSWLVRPDNRLFARAIANRVWAQYLGRGLVHPVDNLSDSNAPSHPELLDALTAWLVAHQFDLKAYVRELTNSRTYQLASTTHTAAIDAGAANAAATDSAPAQARPRWFQHARWRPLSAEELVESWRVVTGYETAVPPPMDGTPPDRYRPLTRDYLLMFFGQPDDGTGEFQGGLNEHLYLNNGELGRLITEAPGSLRAALALPELSMEERVDRLFLQVLNRAPTADERQNFVSALSSGGDLNGLLADAIWALMTTSEFRFNH